MQATRDSKVPPEARLADSDEPAESVGAGGRGEHELALHVFSISAGMVGACLTGIGLLRVAVSQVQAATIGDEVLAADAIAFVVCCGLSFWSFKTPNVARRTWLRWVVDVLFMAALAIMVVVCSVLAYAIA